MGAQGFRYFMEKADLVQNQSQNGMPFWNIRCILHKHVAHFFTHGQYRTSLMLGASECSGAPIFLNMKNKLRLFVTSGTMWIITVTKTVFIEGFFAFIV